MGVDAHEYVVVIVDADLREVKLVTHLEQLLVQLRGALDASLLLDCDEDDEEVALDGDDDLELPAFGAAAINRPGRVLRTRVFDELDFRRRQQSGDARLLGGRCLRLDRKSVV